MPHYQIMGIGVNSTRRRVSGGRLAHPGVNRAGAAGGGASRVLGQALACLLVGVCPAGGQVAPDGGAPTAAAVASLDSLLVAGRADVAAAAALRLLSDPALPPALRPAVLQRRCVALHDAGRSAEAVPVCEEAVLTAPRDPANHRNLAVCLQAVGRLGRAAGEYQQALEQAPHQFEWRLQYARALRDLGAMAEAARQVEQAARDCPGCPAVDRALADHALRTGQPQRAIAPLQRLMRSAPRSTLRELLVQACWEAGRFGAMDSTLAAVPWDSLSVLEVRLWLQADRARARTERARQLAGEGGAAALAASVAREPAIWALAAEICLAGGDLTGALAAIDRATSLAPEDGRWHRNRAAILARLGRNDEAEVALARARSLGQGGP